MNTNYLLFSQELGNRIRSIKWLMLHLVEVQEHHHDLVKVIYCSRKSNLSIKTKHYQDSNLAKQILCHRQKTAIH